MRVPDFNRRKAVIKGLTLSDVMGEYWSRHIIAPSWEACELDRSNPDESDIDMTQASQLELGGSDGEKETSGDAV